MKEGNTHLRNTVKPVKFVLGTFPSVYLNILTYFHSTCPVKLPKVFQPHALFRCTSSETHLCLFICLGVPSELTSPVYCSLRILIFTSYSQQPSHTQVLTENDLMKALFPTNITAFSTINLKNEQSLGCSIMVYGNPKNHDT